MSSDPVCAGCVDVCVGGFGPGGVAKAFLPRRIRTRTSPRSRGAATGRTTKGRTTKGRPLKEEPRGDAKELLKAGGELPLPQKAVVPPKADNHGRFPLWRVAGMVLNAGLFVFSFYRLLYKTQAHEKLRISSPGVLRVVLLTVPDRKD